MRMLQRYQTKLVLRILIFLSGIYIYIFHTEWLEMIYSRELHRELLLLYALWLALVVGMLYQLIPNRSNSVTMGSVKYYSMNYFPANEPYRPGEMNRFIQLSNIGALKVLASWLLLVAFIGILYFGKMIDRRMLFLITLFFYISDLICVVAWCPFQSWMMKNKCCVNCRIFNWDHAMMFSPFVFIPSFFTWSLLLLSLVIVVRWEYVWWKYPQRFWFRTNKVLQCKNCTEKMCRIKGPLLKDPAMHEHGIK